MDLALSEEQALIQDTARKFSAAELAPVAASLDSGGGRDKYLSNLKQMADLGLMGINVSDEYGGTNAGVHVNSTLPVMTEIFVMTFLWSLDLS